MAAVCRRGAPKLNRAPLPGAEREATVALPPRLWLYCLLGSGGARPPVKEIRNEQSVQDDVADGRPDRPAGHGRRRARRTGRRHDRVHYRAGHELLRLFLH